MIEIRPALPGEITREKELWKLAFGDEDRYINYFYRNRKPEDTLVLLDDGVLDTMVALFPMEVILPDGTVLKSAYIYALATDPSARKKGFGRFILSYVDFYLKEQGMPCVTIVPAEASLHRFFGTAGFLECFTTRKVELMGYMAGKAAPGDTIEKATPAEYRRIREGLLADTLHVAYSEEVLTYQQGLAALDRGGLYRLVVDGVEGCCEAEYTGEETVAVKELLIPTPQMAGAVALVAKELPADRFYVRTPAFWDGLPGSYPQAFGMVKWYDPALERAWRDQSRGYMGLGFD